MKGEGSRAEGPTIHTPPKKTESPSKGPRMEGKKKGHQNRYRHQDRAPFGPARLEGTQDQGPE
ncbi:MAG: hypothetical protein EBS53_11675 [Bacteroidetes bacterium]|nr:hypothetical protein [Bacteroidota bacterium]